MAGLSAAPTYVQNRRDSFRVGPDFPTLTILQSEDTADEGRIHPSARLINRVVTNLGLKDHRPSTEALDGYQGNLENLEGVDLLVVADGMFPQVRLAFSLETFEKILNEPILPPLNKPSRFRRVASVIPLIARRSLKHTA